MAVTNVALTVAKANPPGKTLFHVTSYSADWSGGEESKAAPTSGAIYIERMMVFVGAAVNFVFGDGTKDWTFVGTAEGTVYNLVFKNPVKLANTTALVGTAAAGKCLVDYEGFVS
jgi:hypothetical protein